MLGEGQIIENFDKKLIKRDLDLQARAKINPQIVTAYAKEIGKGQKYDPIILFREGEDDKARYWLADGWHRLHAYDENQAQFITVRVYEGTKRDAMLYAVGANAKHGLKRSTADKQRAIDIMLLDKEWQKWSDQEISRRVYVDAKTVGNRRKKLEKEGKIKSVPNRKSIRKGKDITTNTKEIGKKKEAEQPASANPQNGVAQEEPSQPDAAVKPNAAHSQPPSAEQVSANGHAEPLPVEPPKDMADGPDTPGATVNDAAGSPSSETSEAQNELCALEALMDVISKSVQDYQTRHPQASDTSNRVLRLLANGLHGAEDLLLRIKGQPVEA